MIPRRLTTRTRMPPSWYMSTRTDTRGVPGRLQVPRPPDTISRCGSPTCCRRSLRPVAVLLAAQMLELNADLANATPLVIARHKAMNKLLLERARPDYKGLFEAVIDCCKPS